MTRRVAALAQAVSERQCAVGVHRRCFRRAQTSGKGYEPSPALIDNPDPANEHLRRDQQEFMERAMGIEPTSEGWEARSKNQALELAALSKFGEASNGK